MLSVTVAPSQDSGNATGASLPGPTKTTETRALDSDQSVPVVNQDARKMTETPLAPVNTVSRTEVASVSVPEPINEEPPSVAKDDRSSKVDAADTLAQWSEKQTDQIHLPVSQPLTTETIATGLIAPVDAESRLSPKPVSVEEVGDEEILGVKAPVSSTVPTNSSQPDKASEVISKDTSETGPEKSKHRIGEKRKVYDDDASGSAEARPTLNSTIGDEPAEKKQKSTGSSTDGTSPKKPGRPKKEKKPLAPVGKTARRTRSQGAADVQ